MYNEQKLKTLKIFGGLAIALLLVLTAFAIGSKVGHSKKVTEVQATKIASKQKKEKTKALTNDIVNDFLVKYYTRKKLGENRNRYRPLMTDAMYTQAVNNEELPVNQAYKGYIVDQVFSKSDNYINQENLTVICHVSYKNTQLQKLGTKENALLDQNNETTIQLVFTKEGDKYLVNSMSPAVLEIPTETSDPNSYPTETEVSETKENETASDTEVTYSPSQNKEINPTKEEETK